MERFYGTIVWEYSINLSVLVPVQTCDSTFEQAPGAAAAYEWKWCPLICVLMLFEIELISYSE